MSDVIPTAATTGAVPAPAVEDTFRRASVWEILRRDVGAMIALVVVCICVAAAILAPWISPGDPYGSNLAVMLRAPGDTGLLGTDAQGRDMVTRLLFGLRTTLLMGVASVVVGCGIGAIVGFLSAYYPRLSGLLMRLMDVLLSFPAILFGLAIAAIFGPGLTAVVIALSIATIPLMARVVRGSAIVVMHQDYVEGARSIGMSDRRLIFKYLLPNCLSSIFVFLSLRFGQVILLGSALSFIGLGAQPPVAELGTMAADGRNYLFFAPHVSALPSALIFIVVLTFNVLGDALRDALDPKLRR